MSEIDDLIRQKPDRLWYVLSYRPEQPTWIAMSQGANRDYLPGVPDPATVELRALIDSDLEKPGIRLYRLVPVE